MNRPTACLAALVLALLGSQVAAQRCVTPPNVNALASEIASGLNSSRRANGQSALQFNRDLGQAAMAHACDMMVNDFFDHQGSDRSTVQRRVRATGYTDCLEAENIAWGYPRAAQIITGWMDSPGHRRNMLHPRVEEFGIGITQGAKGPYWVLVLGRSC